jgi:hypothetical protein
VTAPLETPLLPIQAKPPSRKKKAAATVAVGTGLLAGGAELRHSGVKAAQKLHPHKRVAALSLLHGGAKGRVRYGAGWLGATAGGAGMGLGAHDLVYPPKETKAAYDDSTQRPKVDLQRHATDFVRQGLEGNREAFSQRVSNARKPVPARVRAEQVAASSAAGGVGSLAAHRILDRRSALRGGKEIHGRHAIAAVAGTSAIIGSLPLSSKLAHRHGYEITATGVRRRKTPPVRPTRSKVVETRPDRSGKTYSSGPLVKMDVAKAAMPLPTPGMSRARFLRTYKPGGTYDVPAHHLQALGVKTPDHTLLHHHVLEQKRSMLAHGQKEPLTAVVMGPKNKVVLNDGNHRQEALQEMGRNARVRVVDPEHWIAKAAKVHLAVGRDGRPVCGAGARWRSTQISSVRGPAKVNCAACRSTHHFRSLTTVKEIPVIAKLAPSPGQNQREQRDLLRRKKRSLGISMAATGIGTAGVGLLAARELGPHLPKIGPKIIAHAPKLERAGVSTALAGGGIGAYQGASAARTQRRELAAQSRALDPKETKSAAYYDEPADRATRRRLRRATIDETIYQHKQGGWTGGRSINGGPHNDRRSNWGDVRHHHVHEEVQRRKAAAGPFSPHSFKETGTPFKTPHYEMKTHYRGYHRAPGVQAVAGGAAAAALIGGTVAALHHNKKPEKGVKSAALVQTARMFTGAALDGQFGGPPPGAPRKPTVRASNIARRKGPNNTLVPVRRANGVSKSTMGGKYVKAAELSRAGRRVVRGEVAGSRNDRKFRTASLEERGPTAGWDGHSAMLRNLHKVPTEPSARKNVHFATDEGKLSPEHQAIVLAGLPKKVRRPIVIHGTPSKNRMMSPGTTGGTAQRAGTTRPAHILLDRDSITRHLVGHEYVHAEGKRSAGRHITLNQSPAKHAAEEARADAMTTKRNGRGDIGSGYEKASARSQDSKRGNRRVQRFAPAHGFDTEEYNRVRAKIGNPTRKTRQIPSVPRKERREALIGDIGADHRKHRVRNYTAGGVAVTAASVGTAHEMKDKRKVIKIDTTMTPEQAQRHVKQVGEKGPLPKDMPRHKRMKAYEARYVHAGGPKGEKWKRRADNADHVTGGMLAIGGAAGLTELATKTPRATAALARRGHNAEHIASRSGRVGIAAGTAAAGSELFHRHAQHKQASYASSPAGVAASALRRMRDYTP